MSIESCVAAAVDAAITSRRSVRAFLPTPVPRETVADILGVASRAPSGTNTQPWKVHVLTGAAKDGLSAKIRAAYEFHRLIVEHLGLGAAEMVVCGMSLGYADPDAVENRLATEREPIEGFVRFHG
jgi:nitroreductase